MKKIALIILVLSLFMLVSCINDNATNEDLNNNGDGLSADKTYYQLTAKDGTIVRIPIGKATGTNPTTTSSSSPYRRKQTLRKENGEGAEIFVFSEYSIISWGYGEIKNPVKDGAVFKDANGVPYTVSDEHILVVQCFDKDINSVEPTDSSVKYACVYVLEYEKENPDSIWIIEQMEYLLSKDRLESYYKQEGYDYTENIVRKTYITYENYAYECKTDTERYVTIDGKEVWEITSTLRFKVDGTPISRTDFTYPSAKETRQTTYVNDLPLHEEWYKNGSPIKYIYYYSNGVLESEVDFVGNATYSSSYDIDGNLISRVEKDEASDGTKTCKVTLYDAQGNVIKYTETRDMKDGTRYVYNKDYSIRDEDFCEYINGSKLYKVIEYYFDTEIVESIWVYHGNGKVHTWEKFDENGELLYKHTYGTDGELIETTQTPAFPE